MSRFRVLITDYAWPTLAVEQRILAAIDAQLVVAQRGDADELIALAADVDAILCCWKPLPAAALDAAPRCVVVCRYGIGLDNIPVDHATELGIVVANVPDFCQEEVADHTLALILACARRIVPFVQSTRAGVWNPQLGRGIPRLRGQVLGLVGYGAIARTLAHKARGIGLAVMAYTPRLATDALAPWGRATNDLPELLAAADYVSLHLPLTPETRGLIDAAALAAMKPTAYLINTSRGAIIDEDALLHALREGLIAGAALDVLRQEPPPADHPLLHMDNVLVTPHAAFYSEAAIEELTRQAARQVVQALTGARPDHIVNPTVLSQANCRLRRLRGASPGIQRLIQPHHKLSAGSTAP